MNTEPQIKVNESLIIDCIDLLMRYRADTEHLEDTARTDYICVQIEETLSDLCKAANVECDYYAKETSKL